MSDWKDYQKRYGNTGLSTQETEDLYNEISKRERTINRFPIEVFNDRVKPYIEVLSKEYDIPSSFIGLTILSAYSTVIGSSYYVTTDGDRRTFLPVWACLVGISSSGKSVCINEIYKWIMDQQDIYDLEFTQQTEGLTKAEVETTSMPTILFRDSHIPTVVKSILPDNPKGTVRHNDELIEWINSMNQLSKKEGTDEQFWLSSWDCGSYNSIRSGKQKTSIKRLFVNIIGGIQHCKVPSMFQNDRDTTGFIFRALFALPESDKIANINPRFKMPAELRAIHMQSLKRLYCEIPVYDWNYEPKQCKLDDESIDLYIEWSDHHRIRINEMENVDQKGISSGILGKMKNYAMRFAALLHLSDIALDPNRFFKDREIITIGTMEKAIKLAEYFYHSAEESHQTAQNLSNAPINVMLMAALVRNKFSLMAIAETKYAKEIEKAPDTAKAKQRYKQKVHRDLNEWRLKYPKVFGIK